MDEAINEETLNFIYEVTKETPNILSAELNEVRSRLFQVFGVSSALIGLGGFGVQPDKTPTAAAVLLGVAMVFYIGSTAVILLACRTVQVRTTYYGDELWPNEWQHAVADIKHSIVTDVVKAYKHNAKLLRHKAASLNAAIFLTAVETLLIGASVISRWVAV